MAKRAEKEGITRGSGNVFADLGFENPEEELAKAELVIAIARAMSARKMTQVKLAQALGIDQPAVSKLLRGRTEGYTTDRLMKILNQLGQDVEITVRPTAAKTAKVGRVFVTGNASSGKDYVASGVPVGSKIEQAVKQPKGKYVVKRDRKK